MSKQVRKSYESKLADAMKIVGEAIRSDEDYKRSWIAPIAMEFKDEFHRQANKNEHLLKIEFDDLHEIANNAANNFLNMLTKKEIKWIDPKSTDERKEVSDFMSAMEHKLKAKDYKGGWSMCDLGYLIGQLNEEFGEANECDNESDIMGEVVDIANYCMMIYDNLSKIINKNEA